MGISKLFIVLGISFLFIGVLWSFIGKLPGDIVIRRGNTTFFFPIVTSIVVSIVLTLIFFIIGKFR
ncbi:DUF2905 domain-containing protein [Guptibacillus hwajinpoensis]|uniref:DUF2905 domain-containing protein n=1 Tax=Guptibacillus hwajinpoensis TaxID=208199 RepID=A0A0J6CZV5_9BACL|nr:DUF2905 domain-containing protein [Alkalihalobacillus macyae]KMM37539.1 hypothetical protein AB986_16990 [Alkalihalobacillus macyae]MDP4550428.1 DUF2905 domain-containing protein [Alkalihalobacillus macyae]